MLFLSLSIVSSAGISFYLSMQFFFSPQQISLRFCSIVIPEEYLFVEGCILFTFQFICKAHIWTYNDVFSAVLISWPRVSAAMFFSGPQYFLLRRALVWACSIVSMVIYFPCNTSTIRLCFPSPLCRG